MILQISILENTFHRDRLCLYRLHHVHIQEVSRKASVLRNEKKVIFRSETAAENMKQIVRERVIFIPHNTEYVVFIALNRIEDIKNSLPKFRLFVVQVDELFVDLDGDYDFVVILCEQRRDPLHKSRKCRVKQGAGINKNPVIMLDIKLQSFHSLILRCLFVCRIVIRVVDNCSSRCICIHFCSPFLFKIDKLVFK